jgi:hypothetical protein
MANSFTLGQFALAVGVTPRWVLNALTRLKVPRRYDEPLARRLALARVLADALDQELPRAFQRAGRILAAADLHQPWTEPSGDGLVTVTVDLPRVMTLYAIRLSLARNRYGERPRGRMPRRRSSAVARAQEWGMDTTLLTSALVRSPGQRLETLHTYREELLELRRAVREGRR